MFNMTARGFKLREDIKIKVQDELQRVSKMLPSNAEYDITFTYAHDEFKCDITVHNLGTFVRGEASADEILPAVDAAVDDLKRKLRKLKTRYANKNDVSTYGNWVANYEDDGDAEDAVFNIAREKRVTLSTMTDEEAMLQMELLGHSFFVYRNEAGETVVLYKRNNNSSYGKLICN